MEVNPEDTIVIKMGLLVQQGWKWRSILRLKPKQEHVPCPLRNTGHTDTAYGAREVPCHPSSSQDVVGDSGKHVLIAVEGLSDVIATTKRTITEEPVTKEDRSERKGVGRLLNPEMMEFPPNIFRGAASRNGTVRIWKQKQKTPRSKTLVETVGKYNLLEDLTNESCDLLLEQLLRGDAVAAQKKLQHFFRPEEHQLGKCHSCGRRLQKVNLKAVLSSCLFGRLFSAFGHGSYPESNICPSVVERGYLIDHTKRMITVANDINAGYKGFIKSLQ